MLEALGLNYGAAPLAAPVDHLLVRKDGLVLRAPFHGRLLAKRLAGLEELQKEPLRPAVVLRLVNGDLPVPVDRPPHALHLDADLLDVLPDDVAWVPAVADGGVLCVQAEGVETHRAHHSTPVPALVMREHVALRVVAYLAHVQGAGRVGQHLEQVEVAAVRAARVGRVEGAGLFPGPLPLGLDCLRVVLLHTVL